MKTHAAPSSHRRGFALILVMIVVIALTSLVASFAISMNTEIRLARNSDYDEKLEWMGRSGVEEARFLLSNKSPEQRNVDALNQYWAGGSNHGSNDLAFIVPLENEPMGEGSRTLKITDMERKWPINIIVNPQAPQNKEILQKAFQLMGLDPSQTSTIEESLLEWVTPNGMAGFNSKNDYYARLDPPYYCKGGPIDDLSELLLIKGITPEIFWGSNATNHPVSAYQNGGSGGFDPTAVARSAGLHGNKDEQGYPFGLHDLFSPWGARLNVNTASALTLQLIPGIDQSAVESILHQRAGPDGVDGTDDDLPLQNIGELNSGFQGGNVARPGNVAGAPPAGVGAQALGAYVDVKSNDFLVEVDAQINGYKRTFYGVLVRAGAGPGGGAAKFTCIKFYWE